MRPVFFAVAIVLLVPIPTPAELVGMLRAGEATPSAPPLCVPATEPHVQLVYSRPFDANDTYAQTVPMLRRVLNESNGYVQRDGEASGYRYAIKTRCDADGLANVTEAILPTANASDSYESIWADLNASGLAAEPAKLLVAHAGRWLSYGGFGHTYLDDRPGPDNPNNAGGSVAVVFTTTPTAGGWVFLHELAHTLGAVQDSAPHATLAGHCNDGSDILCRQDEGANSDYETVCGTRRFDCGGDDYFAPSPEPGSYLATHWNLASPHNRYFAREPIG